MVSFCLEKKIILFYLPTHSTHLLQSCDIGVFGPLADTYRKILNNKTKWGASYEIDKLLFLGFLQEARIQSLNEHNIKRSWEKTGLFLFNPEVVIGSLPSIILEREKVAQA
jgi:hypothetical protein